MGGDELTPANDGPGNEAYQRMRAMLAEAQRN